ncbi:uncharacterized protein BKA78DRAFT_101626 [Phyllosticta capitalensis]|uniref:uncharacterized protein n=1 Tax=Phyllosticta capitalensis TaxID=121624 RepID=UPI00312E69D0
MTVRRGTPSHLAATATSQLSHRLVHKSFLESNTQQRDTTSNPAAASSLSCDWCTKGLLEPQPSLDTDIIPPRHRRSTLAMIGTPRFSSSSNHQRKDTSYQRSAASQISCRSVHRELPRKPSTERYNIPTYHRPVDSRTYR